jgi:hypothetical protein
MEVKVGAELNEIDKLTGELMAADVVLQMAIIAKAQHRIRCALASDVRNVVAERLRELGVSEAAADQFVGEPMSSTWMAKMPELIEVVHAWSKRLRSAVRALSVASSKT